MDVECAGVRYVTRRPRRRCCRLPLRPVVACRRGPRCRAAFRPNAGTILNTYAPPADALVLPSSTLPKPVRRNNYELRRPAPRSWSTASSSRASPCCPPLNVEAQLADLIGQKSDARRPSQGGRAGDIPLSKHGYFLARAMCRRRPSMAAEFASLYSKVVTTALKPAGSARLGGAQADKHPAGPGRSTRPAHRTEVA